MASRLIYGWILPSRTVIRCSFYGHLPAIAKNDEAMSLLPSSLQNFWEDLEYIESECQALANKGEHPEWHCYEIAESDYRHQVRTALYNAGAVRFGTYKISSSRIMTFEGKGNGLANLKQKCEDFAEENDFIPEYERVDRDLRIM